MSDGREQVIQVELWLRARNNSTFVRGKAKVRQHIEDRVLRPFAMHQPDSEGWEYPLMIPPRTEVMPDERIADLLREADALADRQNGFIEAEVQARDGSERSW